MRINIEVEPMHALPCAAEILRINKIDGDLDDFGSMVDESPYEDPEPYSDECYSCGDMQFQPKNSTKEVLEKYHLSLEDYDIIIDILKKVFDVGSCGWCV